MKRLSADWEREIFFHCKPTLYLEILQNHALNSLFPATPVLVKVSSCIVA